MTKTNTISALVCGASQGIGRATALELAAQGIRVHALARSSDKLQSLKEELSKLSDLNHSFSSVDFGNSEQLQVLLNDISKQDFQILICNSGGPKGGPLAEAQADEFLNAFQAHVIANQKILQAILPNMKEKKWGRVVNIISTSVKMPILNLGVSNTIRGAVAQWAKTLSLELGPFNITVNNVLPGYTETERLDSLLEAAAERLSLSKESVSTTWKNAVPLKRFGQAQEVAWAVAFLCSEKANYISGINLPVDGGRTGTL